MSFVENSFLSYRKTPFVEILDDTYAHIQPQEAIRDGRADFGLFDETFATTKQHKGKDRLGALRAFGKKEVQR